METKIEKLKGKLDRLEQVEQLNLDLQQELSDMKKDKRSGSGSGSGSSNVVNNSLKGLVTRITPKLSDDGVSTQISIICYRSKCFIHSNIKNCYVNNSSI